MDHHGSAALDHSEAPAPETARHGDRTVPSRLSAELAENPFLRAHDAARLGEIRAAKDRF